jgi:hypothetical protein
MQNAVTAIAIKIDTQVIIVLLLKTCSSYYLLVKSPFCLVYLYRGAK